MDEFRKLHSFNMTVSSSLTSEEGGGFDQALAIAGVASDEDGEGSIHGCISR